MCETNASKSLKKQGTMLVQHRSTLRNSSAFGVLMRAAPVAFAAFAFVTEAQAAGLDMYNGASGGNWLNGAVWSTGVAPTTADDPTIVGGGSVGITAGQNAQGGRFDVLGGGSVTISGNGSLTTGFLSTIGIAPSLITTAPSGTTLPSSGTGTMTIDGAGATWNAGTPGVRVGNSATGTLTVSNGNGGALNMGGGLLSVGLNANGNGTLNIGAGGSVTNTGGALRLGYNGATGAMNITGGGTLTTTMTNSVGLADGGGTAAGTGIVTISGAGSAWTINSAGGTPGLNVGGGTGSKGTITVSAGGTLSNDGNAFIGYHANGPGANSAVGGGTGTVTITGSGSTWNAGTNGGALIVGYNGGSTGTVTIAAGGTLNTTNATILGYNDGTGQGGGTGTLIVDGAHSVWNATGGDIDVGGSALPGVTGSTGTLTVSNGGSVNLTSNRLQIANNNGSTGTLNILSGGTITANEVDIGNNGSGTAVAKVDGTGSVLTSNTNILLGNGGSSGTLGVTNGGNATAVDGVTVGNSAGATGVATVDGAGSVLAAGTNFIIGAEGSTGSLKITNGGVATSASDADVGQNGTGTMTVDGTGSSFTETSGTFRVGNAANTSGTVTISNGGLVDIQAGGPAVFGVENGSTGTLNITSGGQFNSGNLVFGRVANSTGTLNISSGGQAAIAGDVAFGVDGGTATAVITGANSSLVAAGEVAVGKDSANLSTTGTLTVADGALLQGNILRVGQGPQGHGTLNIGTGGAAGTINAPIVMGGASSIINFNHSDPAYTFSNVISDNTVDTPTTKQVNFIGSGTTIFTNTNTYTAATNINAGELQIAAGGSIASSALTTVNNRGTLSGAGTVGNVLVKSGGTVAPTGFNKLTVNDISFESGSTFRVGINTNGQSGTLAAHTAALGGNVSVMAGSGNYAPGTTYTILTTTNGRTGQFDNLVNTDFTFLQAALAYTGNNVDLTLTRNLTTFASVATTPNQLAVATTADGLLTNNPVFGALVQQNAAGARQAYDALSGEAHASTQGVLINNSLAVADMLNDRLTQSFDGSPSFGASNAAVVSFAPEDSKAWMNYAEDKPADKPEAKAPWPMAKKAPVPAVPAVVYTAWAQGFGGWLSRGTDGNFASLKSSSEGVLSGFDVTWMGIYRVGIAAGYDRSNVKVEDRASSTDVDSYHVSAYGGAHQGNVGLGTGVLFTWNDLSSSRMAAFPGFAQTLRADYGATTTQVFGEGNYRILSGQTSMQAFAGFNFIDQRTDAFNETGGFAGLAVRSSDHELTYSTVGVRTSAVFGDQFGMTVVGRSTLGWRHAFGDVDTAIVAAFAGSSPFTVTGAPITTDALLGEAGLDVNIDPAWTVSAYWSGQFGAQANENRLNGKVVYRW